LVVYGHCENNIFTNGKVYESSSNAPQMTFVFDLADIAKLDGAYGYVLALGGIKGDESDSTSWSEGISLAP